MAPPQQSLPALPDALISTLSSITLAIQLINNPSSDVSTTVAASQNYAAVPLYTFLADFANLVKAHATKLGLISNPPIAVSTYPAIARILVDLAENIPAASSAPQIASKERYGSITHAAVVSGMIDLLRGVEEMLQAVQSNISEGAATTSGDSTKSPYTSTGQIWFSADNLLAISQKHLIGLVELKLQSHADMLNDCIAEFKEWVTDATEELNGEDSGFDEDESQSSSIHADLGLNDDDDFFGIEGREKPKVTKEVLTMAEVTQKKLKLTSILYTAVMKRRVKDPATRLGGVFSTKAKGTEDGKEYSIEKERDIDRLERIVETSKNLVEKADDLAAGFYDGDNTDDIAELRSEFVEAAADLAKACQLGGNGTEDTPSAWFGKFLENVKT
ncbi:hypothetical protein TWF102_006489 [Orbilia oligospora]|uniref:Cyclin-D1-binding protein 1-like N-terminal domain-containing protein n=1 Tax=Orbilia oligospora TaxID=2813651 RepID=A0A7C8JAD1_ORBOL|nr:hypothetical protein TWF103_001633 [Orbilia oligospora]KAF3097051.1 hypothetical protein TWF102_006489 [Orbilia oligospora]KAF3110212.1 hypothetical protein TWF706_000937 [Orbilia oligospora]KAF3131066.1 hypothetical protein TWF594_010140 [Orbilia oligospora]